MSTSIRLCNRNVKFTTSSRCRYHDVTPTMGQLYKEDLAWKLWKSVITTWYLCGMQGLCDMHSGIKFSPLFLSNSLKFSKNNSEGLEVSRMISCSFVARNFAKRFLSIFKTATFKYGDHKTLSQKSGIQISNYNRFNSNNVQS